MWSSPGSLPVGVAASLALAPTLAAFGNQLARTLRRRSAAATPAAEKLPRAPTKPVVVFGLDEVGRCVVDALVANHLAYDAVGMDYDRFLAPSRWLPRRLRRRGRRPPDGDTCHGRALGRRRHHHPFRAISGADADHAGPLSEPHPLHRPETGSTETGSSDNPWRVAPQVTISRQSNSPYPQKTNRVLGMACHRARVQ